MQGRPNGCGGSAFLCKYAFVGSMIMTSAAPVMTASLMSKRWHWTTAEKHAQNGRRSASPLARQILKEAVTRWLPGPATRAGGDREGVGDDFRRRQRTVEFKPSGWSRRYSCFHS